MKNLSFADAYGLGLIAKNPQKDWSGIVNHLSDDARKVADEMMNRCAEPGEVKSAADKLLNLAEKVRNARA